MDLTQIITHERWHERHPGACLLARSARAAEARPDLVASLLAAARRAQGLDEAALAARLGCSRLGLWALALSRCPQPASPTFRSEVQQLAAFTGCDPAPIAALLEETEPPPHRRVRLLLARGARWAEEQPGLLGSLLAAYRQAHGLDDAGLAATLGCELTNLYALALHPRPSLVDSEGTDAIAELARTVGCDAARLTALLAEMDRP